MYSKYLLYESIYILSGFCSSKSFTNSYIISASLYRLSYIFLNLDLLENCGINSAEFIKFLDNIEVLPKRISFIYF